MEKLSQTSDIVRPIGTRAFTAPVRKHRSLKRDIDGLFFIIAAASACLSFGFAAYFFYGFTQTDQGFWTLVSAFGLCFGVGALAYVPCGIIAGIARRSASGTASRKAFAFAMLILMPWICVSLVFIGASALPKRYGFAALFLSIAFSLWAFSRLRRAPKG